MHWGRIFFLQFSFPREHWCCRLMNNFWILSLGGRPSATRYHIGAPGCLVTNVVTNLVMNLVIHLILWSIWWQCWWHILLVTIFVTIFGDNAITLFGGSLILSPNLVTFLSHDLSLNKFTKFITGSSCARVCSYGLFLGIYFASFCCIVLTGCPKYFRSLTV